MQPNIKRSCPQAIAQPVRCMGVWGIADVKKKTQKMINFYEQVFFKYHQTKINLWIINYQLHDYLSRIPSI